MSTGAELAVNTMQMQTTIVDQSLMFRNVDMEKEKRSFYIKQIFNEKKDIHTLKNEHYEHIEFNKRLAIWRSAMDRAAGSSNDVSISWQTFDYIDPCIYEYHEVYGKHMTTLRLIGIGLTKLPEEVGYKLRSLKILNLSNNELIMIPESILQLTNLKELHLTHNKLKKLPERIGLMGSLCRLELANNHLEKLPVTLAGLTKIDRLDVESNSLKLLPENLDAMKNCKTLNFNHNKLSRLPRCLGRMPNLITLSASWNQITYIPEELCASKTLKHIRLNLNCISLIPEKIGIMTQLYELSLDSNRLSGFPMSFYLLVKLKVLRVESNPHLLNPSAVIIGGGAVGVIAWCTERFKDNELARMRYIIQLMIDLLGQIERRGIADPSLFEANVRLNDDTWVALQFDYFWDHLLPDLENLWYKELMLGKHDPKESFSFPFSKADVNWAFMHYADAYGPLLVRQKADFKRCGCVDAHGRRCPCVPPRAGYMCTRMCTLIKSCIVLQAEKQRR
jgi:hypothetical protein